MTFDPLFSSLIIAGLVVIGVMAVIPIVRPLFKPAVDLTLHPQPEQKYLLRGILGLGILGFVALIIFAVTQMTRTNNQVIPDPVEALPTTFPEESPATQ